MDIDIFLNHTLWELAISLFWFIQIMMPMLKGLKLEDITYQKALERTFLPATDSDMKQYEEMRKLTTGQELYCSMFVKLWMYQKSLYIYNSLTWVDKKF